MGHARRAGLLVGVLVWSACSSSKKDGPPPPPPPTTFTLSGAVSAAAATAADGDNADVGAPQVHNDTPPTAQALPSVVTVGGWASDVADGEDWYFATLAAGQVVTLGIADWIPSGADLDLCIYTTASPPVEVACSLGVTQTETIPLAESGEYYVQVQALDGASNYLLTLSPAPLAAPAAVSTLRSDAEFVPGEVIVRFRDDVLPAGAADGLDARAASVGLLPLAGRPRAEMLLGLGKGADRARAFAALGAREPRPDPAADAVDPLRSARTDTLALVKALRRRPDVLRADLNYVHHPSAVPDDTHYGLQWHYPQINLPQAWDVSTGSASVIVAVVDTGLFLDHPDLSAQLVAGYDFILDPARARDGDGIDADPDDPGDATTLGNSSYHGTHVAGTVAAASDNGSGVAGVSWLTRIMPLRVLGLGGGTSFDIIRAVRWAAGLEASPTPPPQPAKVVNLSLGCQNCFSSSEQAAYTAVRDAGVIVVAAAGNENSGIAGYPASYAGVVSVSAVDMLGNKAPYSNFGPSVDLAAPGGDSSSDRDHNGFGDGVLSTWKDDTRAAGEQAVYRFMQGTSMASPHVAGVVALMKAVCPTLTPAQVDTAISTGAMTEDLGAAGRDDFFGHGLVDAFAAIQAAQEACSQPPATTLGVAPTRLDFGPSGTALPLTVTKDGPGTLPTVSATDDAAWLVVAGPGGDGLGAWSATADRTGLPSGLHSATVTFTAGTSTVLVPVTVQVGGVAPGPGNLGHLYILLTDTSAEFTTVAQTDASATAGQYAFTFADVPAGSYYLFAGTNLDGDPWICDAGEACGAYSDLSSLTAIQVSGDLGALDFGAGYEVSIGSTVALPAGRGIAIQPKAGQELVP